MVAALVVFTTLAVAVLWAVTGATGDQVGKHFNSARGPSLIR
jgi:hypothetical protein